MSIKDIIEAEAAAAESAEGGEPARDLSKVDINWGRSRTKVLQVRLNENEYEAIQAAAGDLPASTFARSVLLKALSPASDASGGDQATLPESAAANLHSIVQQLFVTLRDAEAPELALLVNRKVAPLEARLEALERRSA